MKITVHDGSRSYSIESPNPEPGKGKHAKTELQKLKRHHRNVIRREGIKALNEVMKGE